MADVHLFGALLPPNSGFHMYVDFYARDLYTKTDVSALYTQFFCGHLRDIYASQHIAYGWIATYSKDSTGTAAEDNNVRTLLDFAGLGHLLTQEVLCWDIVESLVHSAVCTGDAKQGIRNYLDPDHIPVMPCLRHLRVESEVLDVARDAGLDPDFVNGWYNRAVENGLAYETS